MTRGSLAIYMVHVVSLCHEVLFGPAFGLYIVYIAAVEV